MFQKKGSFNNIGLHYNLIKTKLLFNNKIYFKVIQNPVKKNFKFFDEISVIKNCVIFNAVIKMIKFYAFDIN